MNGGQTLIEDVWKWFLRLLITVVMLLLIAILGIAAVNVPGAFDTVDKFGAVADSAGKVARSVDRTSERAYEVLEDMQDDRENGR